MHPAASLLCADNVPCNLNAPWPVPSSVPISISRVRLGALHVGHFNTDFNTDVL